MPRGPSQLSGIIGGVRLARGGSFLGPPHPTVLTPPFGARRKAYWVGGTGNWSDAANHWSSAPGGAPNALNLPDTNTDVEFNELSNPTAYTVTIDVTSNCHDLFFLRAPATSGTITITGAGNFTISGSLLGLSGMANSASARWSMTSSSPSTFIKSNGSIGWRLSWLGAGTLNLLDALTVSVFDGLFIQGAAGSTFNSNGFAITGGVVNIGGTGAVNLAGSTVTVAGFGNIWQVSGVVPITMPANIVLSVTTTNCAFAGAGYTYNAVTSTDMTTGNMNITGANTFSTLTLGTGAGKTGFISLAANQTVTGTFKYLGNSAINRLLIQSDVLGTQRTITAAAIDAASNFTDFMDIAGAGAAAPFATGTSLGDCLGNSGITFTTPAQQFAKLPGTGNQFWSTASIWFLATNGGGGAGRIPLPQDDVRFDANSIFGASTSIHMDMPRAGKSISFVGVTNAPGLQGDVALASFGSVTFQSGMTNASGGNTWSLMARSPVTFDSAGVSMTLSWNVKTFGGKVTLAGNITSFDTFRSVLLTNGELDTGGFAVNYGAFSGTGTLTRILTLGASTFQLSATGVVWDCTTTTNMTLSAGTSTIKVADNSGASKTFVGGGLTYNNLWFNSTGSGYLAVTGANTFADVKIDKGLVAQWPAGVTNTVATFSPQGAAAGGGDFKFGQHFGTSGSYVATPNAAANQITGDIEIRVIAASGNVATGIGQYAVAKRTGSTSGTLGYTLGFNGVGQLQLEYFAGGAVRTDTCSTGPSASADMRFSVTHNTTTGVTKFFTSANYDPDTGSGTWNQIGTDVAGTSGAISASTDQVEIGARNNGTSAQFTGRVRRMQIYNGIGGTLAVDYNPNSYTTGLTWTSATGEIWTINGNVLVSATNLVGIGSSTTTNATFAKAGGGTVSVDYVSVARNTASTTNTFIAGLNSLNQGNDTNWVFASLSSTTAASAGVGAATGTGNAVWQASGSSAGVGATGCVGNAVWQISGSCSGAGAATGSAQAIWQTAFASAGIGSLNAVSNTVICTVFNAAGQAVAYGLMNSVVGAAAQAAGFANVFGVYFPFPKQRIMAINAEDRGYEVPGELRTIVVESQNRDLA